MEICPDGFSRQGEFVFLEECDLPVVFALVTDAATITIALSLFLITALVAAISPVKRRPLANTLLIAWTIIQPLLMLIRPIFNIFGLYSTELWVVFVVHGTAAFMAGVPIFFLYIELKIIIHSSFKTRGQSMKPVKWILVSMGIAQGVLFLTLPLVGRALSLPGNLAFWLPVVLVDFSAIPYFCYLGISIYVKIRKFGDVEHHKISRKILLSVVVCSLLGLSTGVSGLIALIFKDTDWFLVRMCWIAAVGFNEVIFFSLIGRPSEKTSSS